MIKFNAKLCRKENKYRPENIKITTQNNHKLDLFYFMRLPTKLNRVSKKNRNLGFGGWMARVAAPKTIER